MYNIIKKKNQSHGRQQPPWPPFALHLIMVCLIHTGIAPTTSVEMFKKGHMELQFFLISYLGRNKSSSSFCGIVVILPGLPLYLDVLWLEHCCKTLGTEYSDEFLWCFSPYWSKKKKKFGLLTIDHLAFWGWKGYLRAKKCRWKSVKVGKGKWGVFYILSLKLDLKKKIIKCVSII